MSGRVVFTLRPGVAVSPLTTLAELRPQLKGVSFEPMAAVCAG